MSIEQVKIVDQLEQDILAWRRTELDTNEFCNKLYIAYCDFHVAPEDRDEL